MIILDLQRSAFISSLNKNTKLTHPSIIRVEVRHGASPFVLFITIANIHAAQAPLIYLQFQGVNYTFTTLAACGPRDPSTISN